MDTFDNLFAQYHCAITDEEIKKEIDDILGEHVAENNTPVVWQQCLSLIDLTTLNGDDTTAKVADMTRRVNGFAHQYPNLNNVAAICVYPALVPCVKDNLSTNVSIAAVAGGFPASQTFIEVKIAEAAMAVHEGADEIDIVLSIGKFLEGQYQEVFDEISEIKQAIGDAHLKVILETGALKSAALIYKASIVALSAGADFIKTSTGKIAINATPEATCVMCHALKDWYDKTGIKAGFKAAGGISTTDEAVAHYTIVKHILGEEWLHRDSMRFGASRLANNLLTSILGSETKYY